MPEGDLDLVDALVQLSFTVQSIVGSAAARHDLSVTQLRLLGILRDRTPGMLELAEFLQLEKSSVTGLVDRAQRRGLVQRSAAQHDGRGIEVALTAKGRRLARTLTREVSEEIETVARTLNGRDQAHLSRLAARVIAQHAADLGS